MTPKDFAGIFSRYFVVGFFVPSFFVLVLVAQGLSSDMLPGIYEKYSDGTRVAVLGGAGLLVGLLLLGLNYNILRLFEGYPLNARQNRCYASWLYRWWHDKQLGEYNALVSSRDSKTNSSDVRSRAAWDLDHHFPMSTDKLLPTRFGNVVKGFEDHAFKLWRLDSVAVWPSVELTLSDGAREAETDVRTEVAFFVNAALLSYLAALALTFDELFYRPLSAVWLARTGIPLLLGYALYRGAVGAAIRWGDTVKAAIDLGRFDVYRRIGVRVPKDLSDEREAVAPAVGYALGLSVPVDNDVYEAPAPSGAAAGAA